MQKLMTRLITIFVSILILVLITACSPSASEPTVTPPPGTFQPQQRNVPTQTPPPWVAAGENISLSNVPRIAYLGRLDALGTSSTVFAYAFSPDGSQLVGLNNEQLIGWSLVTGKLEFNTARLDAVQVYYGTDKTEVYTIDGVGNIRVYDTDGGQLKQTLVGHPAFDGSAAYDSDNGLLAVGGLDGAVKVWDVAARQSLVTIQAHTQRVNGVAFSSDSTQLATFSDDKTIKVWDWRAKKLISQTKAFAYTVVFSPDGTQLAVGEDRQITLWNPADGKQIFALNTGIRAPSDKLIYSPDGQYIINGGSIQTLTVWDAKTGKLVNTLPGAGGDENTVDFTPNGDLLVTSVLGGDVNIWDVSSMRAETLNRATLSVGTRQILYSDWSSDGFILLLVDATGPIQVWGIAPSAPTATPGS